MILLRSMLCPVWRRMGLNLIKPILRNESTATTANISQPVSSNAHRPMMNNALVFEYKDRILPIVGFIGLVQFIAFGFIAHWSFYLFGTVTAKEDTLTSDSTLLERAAIIVPTKKFRYTTNIVIELLSKFRTLHTESVFSFILKISHCNQLQIEIDDINYHKPQIGNRDITLLFECQ